jgi:CRP-like cAMP-binding protein
MHQTRLQYQQRTRPKQRKARVNANDTLELLRSQALFCDLKQSELKQLVTAARRRTFDAEAYIFRQGECGATCHIILRGKVRVFVIGEDGRELSVR